MSSYWASRHQCATCQYWSGPRQVGSDPRVVQCDPGAKGICTGYNRQYRGKQVSCSLYVGGGACYEMWSRLRED